MLKFPVNLGEYAKKSEVQEVLDGMVEEYNDEEVSVQFPIIIDDLEEIKEQYSDISNNVIPNIREHLDNKADKKEVEKISSQLETIMYNIIQFQHDFKTKP